jgi:hypothetical protein
VGFDWDPGKARTTRRTRRVTFEEAGSVTADPAALVEEDLAHSDAEDRLAGGPDLAGYASPRAALRDALDRIRAGPERYRGTLVVLARTTTARSAPIVSGRFVEGFALGALEAEPIRLITGPAWLPESPE